MLTDREVIAIVRKHIESKFPKDCRRCGRRFESLAAYLVGTTHVGDPISADDPSRLGNGFVPLGAISYANCPCGSTLVISSAGLDFFTMWRLLRWAGVSMARRGCSMSALLADLRRCIDEEVLREHAGRELLVPDNPDARIS